MIELLHKIGWTQVELSRRIGVSENTISSWCKGRTEPPRVVILYLELLDRTING